MTADTVKSYYDRNARHYDRRWSNYLARTLTFLQSRIVVRPQTVILDVGCGTGQFESLILSERPEQQMAGVDISDEMLKVATTKCQSFPNVTFHRADAAALPFADQTFDLVVSASAFHYFAKPAASLAEMRRVVKSDGSVVLLDWCRDYFFCRLFDGILRIVESGYQKCYTQCELHRLLEETPFQIQSFDRVRFGGIWGLMIAEVVRSRLEAETAYLQSDGMEFRDDNLEHFEAHGAPSFSAFSTEGFVEHNRTRIWYATSGSGSPVILLHGGLGHSGNWGYQVPALASAGYQAVLVDSRGHGRSTRDKRPYRYELMASDVLAVMDVLHLEKASIVGWSDGACVALILAREVPARITGVFFFGCNMDPSGANEIAELGPIVGRCFNRHVQDYARLSSTPDQFQDFAQAVGHMEKTQPNYSAADLADVRAPVAIVQSEHDEFIKRQHAEYLARSIPGAEFILLPGVSHFAPLQRPGEFNRVMLSFLRRIP